MHAVSQHGTTDVRSLPYQHENSPCRRPLADQPREVEIGPSGRRKALRRIDDSIGQTRGEAGTENVLGWHPGQATGACLSIGEPEPPQVRIGVTSDRSQSRSRSGAERARRSRTWERRAATNRTSYTSLAYHCVGWHQDRCVRRGDDHFALPVLRSSSRGGDAPITRVPRFDNHPIPSSPRTPAFIQPCRSTAGCVSLINNGRMPRGVSASDG